MTETCDVWVDLTTYPGVPQGVIAVICCEIEGSWGSKLGWYLTAVTPVESSSWGTIKALYR